MKKIKTIKVYNDTADFDKRVNDFCSTEKVFATQTHLIDTREGVLYGAVCFYEEK